MSPIDADTDPDQALSSAFVEVVEALDASISARLERLETRLMTRARRGVSMAALVGIGVGTATVGWISATIALAAFVATDHGVVVAASVATVANLAVALVCAMAARLLTVQATVEPMGTP